MKFVKKTVTVGILGIALAGVGCDNASETVKKGEESLKKGAVAAEHMAEDAIAKAKEEYAKLTKDHFEGIEKKIKDLSGEAMTEAQVMYDKLKVKVESIKETAPEKFAELKAEINEKLAELKAKLGL